MSKKKIIVRGPAMSLSGYGEQCRFALRSLKAYDSVYDIYLTNIPPLAKHKCKTILLQQNRFVVDYYPLTDFPIKTKLQLYIQKLFFLIHNKNTDYIVVQSEYMSSLLIKSGVYKNKIKIIAYKYKEDNLNKTT